MEIFKPIPDYEGLYEASNFGNIKSLKSKHNKVIVLKKSKDNSGYEIVQLCKNGHHSTKTVHRLVMSAFYGLSNMVVNHIDGVKSNNNIDNLEYVTSSQNSRHAITNKLWVPNTYKIAESKRKKVLMICPTSNKILNTFESAHDAARKTGYNRGNISTGCRLNKIFYGRRWKYEY